MYTIGTRYKVQDKDIPLETVVYYKVPGGWYQYGGTGTLACMLL